MIQTEFNSKKLDDEDNPFSVDEIEPRLFLGNVTSAVNLNFLKSKNITHILTIESFPIPNYVSSNSNATIKYIQIADMTRENIIQYFPECIEFINSVLEDPEKKNGVLVHCFYGVSRSATIVIAYLMKKYKLSYHQAFDRAKSKRSLVQPNHGFKQQCKLFYQMNYIIDPNFKSYKMFRLKHAAEKIKISKILPSNYMDILRPDPGLIQENPEPFVYRCRKCKRIVAAKSNLILHKVPKNDFDSCYESPSTSKTKKCVEENLSQKLSDKFDINEDHDAIMIKDHDDSHLSEKICNKIYFIEPLAWMKDVINNVEGKLFCPSCHSKIGSFNWIMASKCVCGTQVSPSFYLVPSKIDFSNIVQNILQVTV